MRDALQSGSIHEGKHQPSQGRLLRRSQMLFLALGLAVAGCGTAQDPPSSPTTTAATSTTTTTTMSPSPTTLTTVGSGQVTTTTSVPLGDDPRPACGEPGTCRHPLADEAVWTLPVLSIRFLPDENSDGQIDGVSTGYTGTVDDLREKIEKLDTSGLWWMTEATRYRHDPTGVPSLGYRLAGSVELSSAVPIGAEVPWNDGWYRPDYMSILSDADVCHWVDVVGVREVWMWTQHFGQIEPTESNMSSPVGDISNSERTDDLPSCAHSYTVYNYNFDRGVAEMLHNHGHQAEAVFGRGDALLFWDLFVGQRSDEGGLEDPIRCGWTHEPPNAEGEYDTHNDRSVLSDCLSWDPDGGVRSDVGCSDWFSPVYGDSRCFDDGGLAFFVWWFQSVPGRDNGLEYAGKQLANWWLLFADLEAVVDNPSWLLEG